MGLIGGAGLALSRESPNVVFAHPAEDGFGVDLGRADPLVPEELLYLIQRHARVQQNSRDARPQAVWGHVLVNISPFCEALDQPLNVSRRVFV